MEELLVKEEPITAETAETISFYISDDDKHTDSAYSSICEDDDFGECFSSDENTDLDIMFNEKLTLLEISPVITLSNIVSNIVSQYLDLMEYVLKDNKNDNFLSVQLTQFYGALPYNILSKEVLKKLKNFRIDDEQKTVTLYKTILRLLDVIENK